MSFTEKKHIGGGDCLREGLTKKREGVFEEGGG